MRQFFKSLFIITLITSSSLYGQELKFGHINSQELIAVMPERDSAIAKLEAHANELEGELELLQVEFRNKYNEYNQKQGSWGSSLLESKTKELQELDARIQQYQQSASQEYQQLQQMLFAPVFNKANEVIKKIGKERGLIYIFDLSSGSMPYINEELSLDILPLAKQAMNIPADKRPQQHDEQPMM